MLVTEFVTGRYPYDRKDGELVDVVRRSLAREGFRIVDDTYKNFIIQDSIARYVDIQGLKKEETAI